MDYPDSYVVYDLETTGLDTSTAEAIEIGAMRVEGGFVVSTKSWLLKPAQPVSKEIERITGIDNILLEQEGRDPKTCWNEFLDFIGNSIVVGHNISQYDNEVVKGQVEKFLPERRFESFPRWIDTAALFKARLLQDGRGTDESHEDFAKRILSRRVAGISYRLECAYKELGGTKNVKAHRALGDVEMTDFVFRRLCFNKVTERDVKSEDCFEGELHIEFLIRHPEFCHAMLCRYYSFDFLTIERYKDFLNWDQLSCNKNIHWNDEELESYINRLNWGCANTIPMTHGLSDNEFLPWSSISLGKYKKNWDWKLLSTNNLLPWSVKLIDCYVDSWDWFSLSSNESLPWSVEFIERYRDKLNWLVMSYNKAIPWSEDFIEKFSDYIDLWEVLSHNKVYKWSEDFIEKFEDNWNWGALGLSGNLYLPWSEDFIERFEDNWDWFSLSSNESLPWSEDLISKFEDRWDWGMLSRNKALPWSVGLLVKFQDKWNWCRFGLSSNEGLPWSEDFIERFKDHWSWSFLSEKIPWSLSLLKRYEFNWNWQTLYLSEALWSKVFRSVLSDESVNLLFKRIQK